MAALIGVPSLMVAGVVRSVLRRRRDRRDLSRRVHEAIEKITADGKVEGPKGKFVWKNWSRKWVDYANSLPAPQADKRMPKTRDFPNYPHPGD
jgi:hypothetical protein